MPEKQRVKRAQCIDKAKTSLLDFCIGDALIKLRSNLRMSSIKNKGSSENCLCSFFILCWDFPIERMTEQSEVNPRLIQIQIFFRAHYFNTSLFKIF
jgi:hypothetical protein